MLRIICGVSWAKGKKNSALGEDLHGSRSVVCKQLSKHLIVYKKTQQFYPAIHLETDKYSYLFKKDLGMCQRQEMVEWKRKLILMFCLWVLGVFFGGFVCLFPWLICMNLKVEHNFAKTEIRWQSALEQIYGHGKQQFTGDQSLKKWKPYKLVKYSLYYTQSTRQILRRKDWQKSKAPTHLY